MFSPKRRQSETFSVRNVVIPNLNFVSPKRHQSESEKNTSSVRTKKKKTRRQSESEIHLVSPN